MMRLNKLQIKQILNKNNLFNIPSIKFFARKMTSNQTQIENFHKEASSPMFVFKGDQTDQEIIKIKRDFLLSLKEKERIQPIDYNQIFDNLMKLIKLAPKGSLKEIDQFFYIYLEKNIQMFTIEQMIQIFGELGKNNLGTITAFSAFQHHLGKKLSAKSALYVNGLQNTEDIMKISQQLFYYFSIMSELSMMEVLPLNVILEFFATRSEALLANDEGSNKILYHFIWYTSISLASILEKRKNPSYSKLFLKEYIDFESPVLSERGARSLIKILAQVDKILKTDTNPQENTQSKVRLYKALTYLKLDGIELGENSEKFLQDFQPFFQINMEPTIRNSQLEEKFESILKTFNLPYEKEKKLSTCSVDYFVKPLICLEVNGPQHYVFNSPLLVGKDLLKRRTLHLQNYVLIDVHYKTIIQPKQLIPFLSQRLKHLTDEEFHTKVKEAEEEISGMKNYSEKTHENEAKIVGEKLEKRLKNIKHLV